MLFLLAVGASKPMCTILRLYRPPSLLTGYMKRILFDSEAVPHPSAPLAWQRGTHLDHPQAALGAPKPAGQIQSLFRLLSLATRNAFVLFCGCSAPLRSIGLA